MWVYLGGWLLGSILGSIGAAAAGDTAGHAGTLTTVSALGGQFGGWGLGLVVVSRLKGLGRVEEDFGVAVRASRTWVLAVGVALYFALAEMVLPLVHLVHNENQGVIDELKKASGAKHVVLLVVAAIVAPIAEEALFRGLLLRALRRRFSPPVAIVSSAFVFAAVHLLGGNVLGTLAVVPALFALGLISGTAAVRTGDLSISIPLHMGFNLVTVAALAVLAR